MPVPDFSPGEVLTAAAMDSIGLWKTGSATATSGSVLDIANCFSADYDAYRVVISRAVITTSAAVGVQLSNAGSPNAGNYYWNYVSGGYATTSTYSQIGAANTSNWSPLAIATVDGGGATFDVVGPFLARRTTVQGDRTDPRTTGAAGRFNGFHDVSTSFSGIYFSLSGGTFTDFRAQVYGYRL
jgi:hypothetical protein